MPLGIVLALPHGTAQVQLVRHAAARFDALLHVFGAARLELFGNVGYFFSLRLFRGQREDRLPLLRPTFNCGFGEADFGLEVAKRAAARCWR